MLLITAVLLVMGMTGNEITFIEGVILWILFIAYLLYLYILAKKGNDSGDEQPVKLYPVWKCLLFIVLGGVCVVIGSQLVVNGATTIARACGMSERFIGLTIVAFGTSLPELVTSVSAARKGNAGIAIGNIVGSNIFNILFVIGTVALICPVPFESRFVIDTVVAILCGVLLWGGTIRHKELRKPCGVVMLLCYAAYFCISGSYVMMCFRNCDDCVKKEWDEEIKIKYSKLSIIVHTNQRFNIKMIVISQ